MDPRAKARRPARIYIQQLCEDTGCSPEDLPEAMNDREKLRERVRDIRATGTTWWWRWVLHNNIDYLDMIRCYHSIPKWTWERWQWKGTLHSPKLQHYWSFIIRLFSIISKTLMRGILPSAEIQSVCSTASANRANRIRERLRDNW